MHLVLPEGATAILLHPETRVVAGYTKDGASFVGPFYTLREAHHVNWVRVRIEADHA